MTIDPTHKYVYILGDGDRIREKIEYHLLNSEIEPLTNFSQALTNAIDKIKSIATSTMQAQVIIAGGDDILFRVEFEKYKRSYIQKMSETFLHMTGSTMSFGIGENLEKAYINIRKAKSSRNNKIIEEVL